MKKERMPPEIFLRFFRWFCHPRLRDHIEGDLIETYNAQLNESGKRKADFKFIIDVLLLFRPGIIKPVEGLKNLNNYGMIKSYFKIGLRNLLKQKSFAMINIAGLSIGITCSLVIAIVIRYELSFDHYHQKAGTIYKVVQETKFAEERS